MKTEEGLLWDVCAVLRFADYDHKHKPLFTESQHWKRNV